MRSGAKSREKIYKRHKQAQYCVGKLQITLKLLGNLNISESILKEKFKTF